MAKIDEVGMRLTRSDDVPASNDSGEAFVFGLQTTKGEIVPGVPQDDGTLAFDFSLRVKPGRDGRPSFIGAFASGPADDRFVYLSWRATPQGAYINRVKARLSAIDWPAFARPKPPDGA